MSGYYEHMEFNAPLSESRASTLVVALAARRPVTVLDLGCGWAELLLRIVAASDTANGIGVDSDAALIERGQRNAAARGLAERVKLVAADAIVAFDPADAVVCIGADHVYGGQADALSALHAQVNPGGVLLFGSGYWQRPPTVDEAAALGATPNEMSDLGGLVALAVAAGFRPLDIQTANEDEWNAFESGFLRDWETWLMAHAEDPDAEQVRSRADTHRTQWLRGYRGVLGFAYLILGVPA